jgi:lipoprotein-anchoring transpeptidase ErfK/SrfK
MNRTLLATLTIAAAACSGHESQTRSPLSAKLTAPAEAIVTDITVGEPDAEPEPEVVEIETDLEIVKEPAFKRITRPMFEEPSTSLRITKTVWVLATPTVEGERLGLISSGTRIPYKSHVVNDECETPWVEVAPRGFACVEVKPSDKPMTSRRERKRALIGRYAIAKKGATFYKSLADYEEGKGRKVRGDMFRVIGGKTLEDGTSLVKTERGEYVESSQVRRLWGSKFKGVDLRAEGAPSGPIAFAVHHRNPRRKVIARAEADPKSRVSKRLAPRQVVTVLETSADGEHIRVGDPSAAPRWVARADLRVIDHRPELPAEVAVAKDPSKVRWADVDLDQQLAVIYEGREAIFATLVSSGRKGDETPTGVFRVTRKKVRTTMRSDRSRRQTYSVAVPWSTYFNEGYAFHTAYWHGSFGKPRSHGCVNLSPADALTVYQLLGPELPAGWSVVYGHDKHQPGSVVRVRSAKDDPKAGSQVASR